MGGQHIARLLQQKWDIVPKFFGEWPFGTGAQGRSSGASDHENLCERYPEKGALLKLVANYLSQGAILRNSSVPARRSHSKIMLSVTDTVAPTCLSRSSPYR